MDTYQPIYDAVRSKISNGNIGNVVAEVARQSFDISHSITLLTQEFTIAALEMQRPSVLFRPTLSMDGNEWCALYGESIMTGVVGFGNTPDAAMRAFDQVFQKEVLASQKEI